MDFYKEVPSRDAVEGMARKYHKGIAEALKARAVKTAQNEPQPVNPPAAQQPAPVNPPVQEQPYIPPYNGTSFDNAPVQTDPEQTLPDGFERAFPDDNLNFAEYENFNNSGGTLNGCRDNICRCGRNCGGRCNNNCNNPCYDNCGCRVKRNCWRVSPRAVRLCQEIIDRMKDVRAIFLMLDRQGYTGYTRAFNALIAEKTANIRIMERVYECLTGFRPLDYRPDFYYVRGFCAGLRQAFLEQSAIIDKIANLNRLIPDPALSRTVTAVGASELRSLGEINRLYARCR